MCAVSWVKDAYLHAPLEIMVLQLYVVYAVPVAGGRKLQM